ncbi:MAG: DinB family protein [Chitinophagales bacterium]
MHQTLWIERSFSFDFPAGLFPVIIARLSGAYPRIQEIVRTFPTHMLSYQPNGKWSMKQQIGHLTDLEALHSGRIEDFKRGIPVLRAADMQNLKTEEARHNEKDVQELLNDFRNTRNAFIASLYSCPDELITRIALHPRLKKDMRLVDMAFFVAEHDDHHIARMMELAKEHP